MVVGRSQAGDGGSVGWPSDDARADDGSARNHIPLRLLRGRPRVTDTSTKRRTVRSWCESPRTSTGQQVGPGARGGVTRQRLWSRVGLPRTWKLGLRHPHQKASPRVKSGRLG